MGRKKYSLYSLLCISLGLFLGHVISPSIAHVWASSVVPAAYNLIQNGGVNLTRRTTINCTGNLTCSDSGSLTTFSGGGPTTICTGTIALSTGAIASAAFADNTAACTGLLTTDTILATFNGSPLAATGFIPSASGMLGLIVYSAANTVHVAQVNNTSGSITPGAITLNFRVSR